MSKKTNKKAAASVTKIEIKTVEVKPTKRVGFKISEKAYDIAMPDGFNFDDYKMMARKNFTTEEIYWDHRAVEAQWRVEQFKARAADCRANGSAADRRKKKQIVRLNSKMNELKAQLIAQGIDVEALIAAAAAE